MSKISTLVLQDFVNARFTGLDPITRKKFNEALKFMVPHARHTPQFKLRRWDGKVSFGTLGGCTFINLLELVIPLIMDAGYEIEIDDQRPDYNFDFPVIDEEYLADKVWPDGHVMAGDPIMLRDYQCEAINRFFQNYQSIQSLATGMGKTILTACLSIAVEPYGRSLIIVPSIDLVKQTEADYINLGLDVGVYYGKRKDFRTHTICTWQSLSVYSKNSKKKEIEIPIEEILKDVVCVIVDECHNLKSNEVRSLLCGPMAHIPLRWGLTGTIPKEEYEFLSLLSSVGPVVGEVKASELQERDVLANCDIEIVQLQEDFVEFSDWDSENNFITTNEDRLAWIGSYCETLAESGNTLILVERRATGFALEKLIKGSIFLNGDTKSDDRNKEYKEIQTATNKIIIATYGIAAVGINVPRLFNLVLFSVGKSFTRVVQSVGRILRKAQDKDYASIKDLTSSLKFSKRHLVKRKEYYTEAGYPFKTTKVRYR